MGVIPLQAGPLRMFFDPQSAFLRYVRCDDTEVVRGIYVAVRDKAWNTIDCTVSDLQVDSKDDRFSLTWKARCESEEIAFEWHGAVTGSTQGTITYHFDGEALKGFLKNRIGICLLHPIQECAGQPCQVEHSDGTTTNGRFPDWISPHQPFKNIRAIRHALYAGVDAQITFEGDFFEMEDQRNWTDASFKTYSTPLERPYPQRLELGQRIKQSAKIELQFTEQTIAKKASRIGHRSDRRDTADAPVRIHVDWNASRKLPAVGLSIAHSLSSKPSDSVVARLREIGLKHLRVDLRLATEAWKCHWENALWLANAISVPLEVAIFCDSTQSAAWRPCLEQFVEQRDRIARWLVLPVNAKSTSTELVSTAFRELQAVDATVPIAFGADGNFADLNRNRPLIPDEALVCYSIHPQMHAFDKLSLCETLEGQAETVSSAYEFFQREVVISPITLKSRYKFASMLSKDRGQYNEPPTDERQSTGFAAAWTTGSLSQLAAERNLASVTYYETHGPRGIMDSSGNPYMTYSVFRAMSGYQSVCLATSSHPLEVVCLALTREDGARSILVGNMGARLRSIVIEMEDGTIVLDSLEPESIRPF